METTPRRMRTAEAAAYVGLATRTLEKLRLTGEGPRYAKLGRICVYDTRELDAWLESRTRSSTSEELPRRARGGR